MFNDRFGLTQAVIEGRKTVTRRVISGYPMLPSDKVEEARYSAGAISIIANRGETLFELKPRLDVGEVVAVAQRYADIPELAEQVRDPFSETYFEEENIGDEPGYRNKMFVKANLMPHRIRITSVRCERLQEISDEDCMREGIEYLGDGRYTFKNMSRAGYNNNLILHSSREAFASLIDKVSGRGTWERNPWVAVYEFELVK